jgi:D-sedoheptulose 7-phosphate isomerase
MMDHVNKYFSEVKDTFDKMPIDEIDRVIRVLYNARLIGSQVFTMGNGGSASTASHFVCDLAKNTQKKDWPAFKVIGLADNIASLSAYANDNGFENIFSQQLAAFVRPGDVVIGISTSGNSINVLRAIEVAKQNSATTIAFTGFTGGRLGSMVDIHVCVPSNCVEQIEDIHLMLEHLICKSLRDEIAFKQIDEELIQLLRSDLASEFNLKELLRRVLQSALMRLSATSGSILMLNEKGDIVDGVLAYSGRTQGSNTQQLSEIIEHGLAGWVVENRRPVLVPNTKDDSRWLLRSWEEKSSQNRSAISVPLIGDGHVSGVLTLVQSQGKKFTEDDLGLLTTIAVMVSLEKLHRQHGLY